MVTAGTMTSSWLFLNFELWHRLFLTPGRGHRKDLFKQKNMVIVSEPALAAA